MFRYFEVSFRSAQVCLHDISIRCGSFQPIRIQCCFSSGINTIRICIPYSQLCRNEFVKGILCILIPLLRIPLISLPSLGLRCLFPGLIRIVIQSNRGVLQHVLYNTVFKVGNTTSALTKIFILIALSVRINPDVSSYLGQFRSKSCRYRSGRHKFQVLLLPSHMFHWLQNWRNAPGNYCSQG